MAFRWYEAQNLGRDLANEKDPLYFKFDVCHVHQIFAIPLDMYI